MKVDNLYKYQMGTNNDQHLIKKCTKQIHKQVILPRIIQKPEINIIIPVFDSLDNGLMKMLQDKKQNLMYYAVKDMMEMYDQETTLTSHRERTPRN